MQQQVYNFTLDLDWKLLNAISKIDRFDGTWTSIKKREGRSLKQLKQIATIRSIGASTRIEGSSLSDQQVEELLDNLDLKRLSDRDRQEVAGYFIVHDIISDHFPEIQITEAEICNLHNQLLKPCKKDEWHRGAYKQHSNAVEATFADGTKQVIFRTTNPGYETEIAMRSLLNWFHESDQIHPIIKAAAFSYDFVSIHPFQDGNGRLSRLLGSLLLLKAGYEWIQYVSLEHEIESRKTAYYRTLRNCQANRPDENITEWVHFFIRTLASIQDRLDKKLEVYGINRQLSPLEKSIITCIDNSPGIRSSQISKKIEVPLPTVKRYLTHLAHLHIIRRHGKGAGTNYTAA